MERPASTNLKCPRCRSKSFSFVEIGEWTLSFEVIDGKIDRSAGYLEPGVIMRLEAQCKCGHQWKVRNAVQIDDAVVEDGDESS